MKNNDLIKLSMPKWSNKVLTEMGGQDPLGLSRMAQVITDYMLTGIITTTDRARYYSFYCWSLWHIEKVQNPIRYQDFACWFRRRESAMAAATILANSKISPEGVQAVKAKLQRAIETGELDVDFKVLPSHDLGGYGRYYSGCLYKMGLTYREESQIDRVAPGKAVRLGELFQSSVENTPYNKQKLYLEKTIAIKDLKRSMELLTLDALTKNTCRAERQELIKLFFATDNDSLNESELLRRMTLLHILWAIEYYYSKGSSIRLNFVDSDLVYPIYYYGVIWPTEKRTYKLPTQEYFNPCRSFWRQFCLQQYLTQALERLLFSILEIAGGDVKGMSLEDIISCLTGKYFLSTLREYSGKSCNSPKKVLEALGFSGLPSEDDSLKVRSSIPLLDSRSECQITSLELSSPEVEAAKSVFLLCEIYAKWRGAKNDPGFIKMQNEAQNDLWLGVIFPLLDSWMKNNTTWDKALYEMISIFIISQHDKTMYRKQRLDSCWLHQNENRILKDQDYSPRFRASRHYSAIRIMCDLGLIIINNENNTSLTKEGRQLLKKMVL